MLPASNKGPSENFGFPDPCLTPPVVPYPNTAPHALSVAFVPNVLVGMIPALNLGSMILKTTGDEPGVLNWTTTGWARFTMGNPVVFVGMLPGICLGCPAVGNKGNCGKAAVVAPGAPNVLYTFYDGGHEEEPLSGEDSREATLDGPPLAGEGFVAEGVGYLRVTVFSWRLPAAADAAIGRLLAAGMRALVLDLRGCPGGELSAFLELAGDFLEGGRELVTMIDADGDEVRYRARPGGHHRFSLALLTNGGTASAAELFAACMKAHGRAAVVGAPTHGKDTGQIVVPAPEGGTVSVTVARFSPPGGVLDGSRRVTPDVHASEEDALAAALGRLAGSAGSKSTEGTS